MVRQTETRPTNTYSKLHYIKPPRTGVSGSIYPSFKISLIHLYALIVAGPFIVNVRYNRKILKFDAPKFYCNNNVMLMENTKLS